MDKFCSNCGKPLPENGVCPCTQQTQAPQDTASANLAANVAPTYVKPNAFLENLRALPKLVVAYCKDPVGVSAGEVKKGNMVNGFIMLGATAIIAFLSVLAFVIRYHMGSMIYSALPMVVTGLLAPAVAAALTFGLICLMQLMGKSKIDMKGIIAVLGVNLIFPAALLVVSLVFSLISYSIFQFLAIAQFAVWVVLVMVILFRVYDLKVPILNLLVIFGGTIVSYYIISGMLNWLISSLFSYGVMDILGTIGSLF